IDRLLAGGSTQPARRGPGGVELGRDTVYERIEPGIERSDRPRRAETQHHAFQVLDQRRLPPAFVAGRAIARFRRQFAEVPGDGNAGRAPPFIEYIEDVRFAEVDFDRTPPRPVAVVALEIVIDPLERHL